MRHAWRNLQPNQQTMKAHKHAALMAEYAKDAAETETPWKRWEFFYGTVWHECSTAMSWDECTEYRRKQTMNTQTNDGGPAFPVQDEGEWLDPKTCTQWRPFNGMTLRDYFAGQALASMDYGWFESYKRESEMASQSYAIADAMLAARERKEGA